MKATKMLIKIITLVLLCCQIRAGFAKLESRIVGGSATTIDEFPYQVSVMYIDSHFCGGTLITSLHILTAAHCTNRYQPRHLLVRSGSTYLNQGGQVRQVSAIFQHPNYSIIDNVAHANDISILKLSASFDRAQVIKLPQQGNPVLADSLGIVTGWGRLSETGPIPMELQKVQLRTLDDASCNSSSIYNGYITDNMFCAGHVQGGKDSCLGDSGGPFALGGVVVGITSWGKGCARKDQPGVYTKVSKYVNFINKIIYQ